MKLADLKSIKYQVFADVRNGSLISQDPTYTVDWVLRRKLKWTEVPNTRHIAGSYFQADFVAIITHEEARNLDANGIENISIRINS